MERKTKECEKYALPKLREFASDYAGSSGFRPEPSLIGKDSNLKKITLDGDLTFTKKKGLWSIEHL